MTRLIALLIWQALFFSAAATDTTYKRDITFTSGAYRLAGQLLLPPQAQTQKVPAIVFLVGSGAESSYRTSYKQMLEENFEKLLLPKGIALLYFDKRGVGASEGAWQEADFYDRAQDAAAAIRFLKSAPDIDTTNIGVIGHSQGGWIAQLVAALWPQDVAYMISLAGPSFSVKQQVVNDLQTGFRCQGLPQNKARKKAKQKAGLTFAITTMLPLQPHWKQLKVIRHFEPAKAIQQIKCPALFLFGENDGLVYPDWSIAALQKIFGGNIPAHIQHQTIAGANHGFKVADLCYKGAWGPLPFAPAFQQALQAWVLQQVRP
ncbi:MAG: alpha/beta hydrolase family protein [Chitinophagaceae bacterium]